MGEMKPYIPITRRIRGLIRRRLNRLRPQRINSSRVYLEEFVRAAAASVSDCDLVLDAGAGNCQYEPLFAAKRYHATDLGQTVKSYGKLSYYCNLASVPVRDNTYRMIICTQTLEHVTDPLRVLRELYRTLAPGGALWLSAPLFYEEHEVPYDFFRYTRFGLSHLLQQCGFRVVSLEPLEGYFGTLSYQLDLACQSLPLRHNDSLGKWAVWPLLLFLRPLFYVLSLLFGRLDVSWKVNAGLCKNYTVVARKYETDFSPERN